MKLAKIMENITNWAKTFPESRTDDMVQVVRLGISKGWYLNEVFLFALYRDFKEEYDLDEFLEYQIVSQWEHFWSVLFRLYPKRQKILNEAKLAYENELYGAAIHIFFTQTDGIFSDQFGKDFYAARGEKAKNEIGSYLTDFISRESFESLIEHYKDATVFRRMYNEVYKEGLSITGTDSVIKTDHIANETDLVMPNRHGVLHGIHTEYGSKINALKCFSLLLFVMYAIHGDATHENI